MNERQLLELIDLNVRFSFSRSGGAGGQNVNKVNTKVTARFPLSALSSLGEAERVLLERRLGGRVNDAGELVVQAQEERSQQRNREIALLKVEALVLQALAEKRRRRPTRPPKGARTARLEAKRHRSEAKARRRGDSYRDQ